MLSEVINVFECHYQEYGFLFECFIETWKQMQIKTQMEKDPVNVAAFIIIII